MKINKQNCTIVAESLKDELIRDITGSNEEWLFGKTPSEHVMIGMIDGAQQEASILKGEEVDDKKFKTIPAIGLRFRVPKETTKVQLILKGKLFFRIRPTYEQELKYLISQLNGKENSTIKTKEDILNFIEEYKKNNEGAEPKEYIVQVNKSISLHDFGYFTIDINDAENCSKILMNKYKKK